MYNKTSQATYSASVSMHTCITRPVRLHTHSYSASVSMHTFSLFCIADSIRQSKVLSNIIYIHRLTFLTTRQTDISYLNQFQNVSFTFGMHCIFVTTNNCSLQRKFNVKSNEFQVTCKFKTNLFEYFHCKYFPFVFSNSLANLKNLLSHHNS